MGYTWGGGSSEFLTQVSVALHYVNLLPEKGGSEGAWPSVGLMCVFTRIFWQKQPKLSSYSNTGHEHSGEDSFLLFPCQMKHRAPSLEKERKKEKKSKTNKSEWSTSGDDQHTARDREVAFPWWQLRSDSDDSTHPLLQKALTYCLFINHTVGSKHGSLSYKYKRDKLRGWYSREKDKKYTLWINVCLSFFPSLFLPFFFFFFFFLFW